MDKRPTFEDLLAPVAPETFFETYHRRQWLHVEGAQDKFGDPLPWDRFNELLGTTTKWSAETLRLYLDGRPCAAPDYCVEAGGSGGSAGLRPAPAKVMALLKQGAALAAHGVDTATPAVAGIADALEAELGTTVACNLYCTWRSDHGTHPSFDSHDVYLVQVHGEKRWNIYENRVDAPLPHPRFRPGGPDLPQEGAGEVAAQVVTRPGDLLYLPRGQYHEPVSNDGASLHLAFGAMAFTGLQFLKTLLAQSVQDPAFRRSFPRAEEGRAALREHLAMLAKRIGTTAADPDFVARFGAYQGSMRTDRGGYHLPIDLAAPVFRLVGSGFRVEQGAADWHLVGPKGRVAIPVDMREPVAWIVETGSFTERDFVERHSNIAPAHCAKLLSDLANMRVIEQVGAGQGGGRNG